MAGKVHEVGLNAVEFLEGMSDLKNETQVAVYVVVCFAIYARQGPVANDAVWIRGMAKAYHTSACRRALDDLIALGKLALTLDGKLTNKRCEKELAKAQRRMGGLGRSRSNLGSISVQSRSDLEANSGKINGLGPVHTATTTTTISDDHTVTPTETVTARARDEGGGGILLELERLRRWRVPDELEARLQKQRPDITTSIMRERTREWREYAAEQGIPRNFERSWFGWQMATPRRRRVRSM